MTVLRRSSNEPFKDLSWNERIEETTAGWHQPSGSGHQPVEDAPSGASAANTHIRRQCRHHELQFVGEQLGKTRGIFGNGRGGNAPTQLGSAGVYSQVATAS